MRKQDHKMMEGEERKSFIRSGLGGGVKTIKVFLSSPRDGHPACVLTHLRCQQTHFLPRERRGEGWEHHKVRGGLGPGA